MIKKQILDDFSSTMTGDSVMGSHTHKQPKKADSHPCLKKADNHPCLKKDDNHPCLGCLCV